MWNKHDKRSLLRLGESVLNEASHFDFVRSTMVYVIHRLDIMGMWTFGA